MKAKTWQDTVIRPKSHSESIRCPHCREEFGIEDVILYEREAQAEISFPLGVQQGRKEAVEWLSGCELSTYSESNEVVCRDYRVYESEMEAKLKEWGIDEDKTAEV